MKLTPIGLPSVGVEHITLTRDQLAGIARGAGGSITWNQYDERVLEDEELELLQFESYAPPLGDPEAHYTAPVRKYVLRLVDKSAPNV